MGAPVGNTNARSARVFKDSLRRTLKTFSCKERKVQRGQAMDKITTSLVKQALDGIEWAIKETANRMDGKPVQVQERYSEVTAISVIGMFRAKLGDDSDVRAMLKAANAENLLPVLDQLMLEHPKAIEHEPA